MYIDTKNITPKDLKIAEEATNNIMGYAINEKDICVALYKYLAFFDLGEKEVDIFTGFLSVSKPIKPVIYLVINKKYLTKKNNDKPNAPKKKSFMDILDTSHDDSDDRNNSRKLIDDYFINGWKNKFYYCSKKCFLRSIMISKDKKNTYCVIPVDPMLFLSFAYDINYADPFYKVSAAPKTGKNGIKKLNEYSDHERKVYKKFNGLKPIKSIIATYSTFNTFKKEEDIITGYDDSEVDIMHNDADAEWVHYFNNKQ